MSFNSFSTSDFNLEGLPDKKKTEPGPKPVKIWGLLLSFELLSSLRMTSNSFRRCKSFENVSSLVKNLSSLIELMAVVDGHKSNFKTSLTLALRIDTSVTRLGYFKRSWR